MCTETERSASNAPFQRLSKATFIITTPTQIPLLKYPVFFARDLKDLREIFKKRFIHFRKKHLFIDIVLGIDQLLKTYMNQLRN